MNGVLMSTEMHSPRGSATLDEIELIVRESKRASDYQSIG